MGVVGYLFLVVVADLVGVVDAVAGLVGFVVARVDHLPEKRWDCSLGRLEQGHQMLVLLSLAFSVATS